MAAFKMFSIVPDFPDDSFLESTMSQFFCYLLVSLLKVTKDSILIFLRMADVTEAEQLVFGEMLIFKLQ